MKAHVSRSQHVDAVVGSMRLEGLDPLADPAVKAATERYVAGQIDSDELAAELGLPPSPYLQASTPAHVQA